MRTLLLMALLLGVFINSNAQDLVYKPKNPAFGGDTFNYQWLLSSAESQNDFKEDTKTGFEQKTELERFKENLNNQLLNKISNSLFENQFGDKGIAEGSYVFGSLAVDIYPSNLGLVVDILDTDTGEQTQIFIPGNN
ncbi:curli assembly protein CsgF [Flavobacterium petrolei]|jgi:curli production assembly/transport component CsgF|uniref:Curli production assembly/transport component CsgF n=1 Tax=Flavobacterium petrolei TaxID=2259594 RepID=A0A482U158_9FLAO|nr:curli production assembly/transport component CsgF [Flavobacterium petrolei]MDD2673754.1 curli assembly protein CsgF [Flavobacterium sp.]RYJ52500.1 curli assembly protein CsgF [Flavobacterium petrolei]